MHLMLARPFQLTPRRCPCTHASMFASTVATAQVLGGGNLALVDMGNRPSTVATDGSRVRGRRSVRARKETAVVVDGGTIQAGRMRSFHSRVEPAEILEKIFSYLDVKSQARVACTCRALRDTRWLRVYVNDLRLAKLCGERFCPFPFAGAEWCPGDQRRDRFVAPPPHPSATHSISRQTTCFWRCSDLSEYGDRVDEGILRYIVQHKRPQVLIMPRMAMGSALAPVVIGCPTLITLNLRHCQLGAVGTEHICRGLFQVLCWRGFIPVHAGDIHRGILWHGVAWSGGHHLTVPFFSRRSITPSPRWICAATPSETEVLSPSPMQSRATASCGACPSPRINSAPRVSPSCAEA